MRLELPSIRSPTRAVSDPASRKKRNTAFRVASAEVEGAAAGGFQRQTISLPLVCEAKPKTLAESAK